MSNKDFNSERMADAIISVLSDKKNVRKLQKALDDNSSLTAMTMMEDRIVAKYVVIPSKDNDTYELLTAKEVHQRLCSEDINIFKLGRALAKMQGIQRQQVQGANKYGILEVIPVGSKSKPVKDTVNDEEVADNEEVVKKKDKPTVKVKKVKKKDKPKSKVEEALKNRYKIKK